MFQSGSQINPALGRTDYSAYTQGAAQGAQAIGQGMQQLGQGIGIAIREYKKKQEEKEQDEYIAKNMKENPEFARMFNVDPTDDKMVKHVVKALGREAVVKGMFQVNKDNEAKAKDERVGSLARALVGGVEIPPEFLANLNGDEVMKAQGMAQGYFANEAGIAKAKAETAALGVPKVKEPNDLQRYLNGTPEERAAIEKYRGAASSKTEVTTVPGIATQGFKTFEAKKDKVIALESTAQAYKDADKAIGEGAFTGTGAKAKLGLAKIGQSLGFNDWDNKIATTEFLRARLAQPTLDAAQVFPGSLSDGDRKFLVEASNGSIEASPATIKRMMDIAQKTADKAKKGYVSDVERVYGKGKETHDPYALSVLSFGEQQQDAPAVSQNNSSLKAKYGLQAK
jgi:hypothetical protein